MPSADADVEVCTLDTRSRAADALATLISTAEARRVAQLANATLQRRSAAAHGLVRALLAAATGLRAQELALVRGRCPACGGPHGRPELPDAPGDWRFNLSHSGDLAVVALAAGRDVGVDVEQHDPDASVERVAAAALTPAERTELARVAAGASRRAAFYDVWTRKEAVAKATGRGLCRPLAEVHVAIGPRGPSSASLDGDPRRFSVVDLDVGPNCSGALAVAGPVAVVHARRWRGQ